jgi:hypothetical protein
MVHVVVPNVDAHPKPWLRVQESLIIIARSSSSEDACQIPVHFYSNLHAERNQHQQFVQQLIAQQPGTQQFFQYQHWQQHLRCQPQHSFQFVPELGSTLLIE